VLIARVVGHVVATAKHASLTGRSLMLLRVEPPYGDGAGAPLMAVDTVGAGVGEQVLVVVEGRSAGQAVDMARAPVDAAIVGIIDRIDPA